MRLGLCFALISETLALYCCRVFCFSCDVLWLQIPVVLYQTPLCMMRIIACHQYELNDTAEDKDFVFLQC